MGYQGEHGRFIKGTVPVKIYTRNGDGGQTGIWGGVRLAKDEVRMEAIGSVDGLNAAVGCGPGRRLP